MRNAIATGNIDVSALLSQVTVPTLVMHARDDARVPFELGRRLAADIPAARFVSLPSRNHLILEDEPAFTRFLQELRLLTARASKSHQHAVLNARLRSNRLGGLSPAIVSREQVGRDASPSAAVIDSQSAGAFSVIPGLRLLGTFGLYGAYLFWLGVPVDVAGGDRGLRPSRGSRLSIRQYKFV